MRDERPPPTQSTAAMMCTDRYHWYEVIASTIGAGI